MKKFLVLLAILSLIVGLWGGTGNYHLGHVDLKVQTCFDTIYTQSGVVQTEDAWFNTIADTYQISDMHLIFANSQHAQLSRWYSVTVPDETDLDDLISDFLLVGSDVLKASKSPIYELTLVPNDTYYNLQWAYQNIHAEAAWNVTTGDDGIIVGVVDSGIDLGPFHDIQQGIITPHADLSANILRDNQGNVFGHNFFNDLYPDIPFDLNGHGTMVAGIIAAETNNGAYVAGMAGGDGFNCPVLK